MTLDKQLERSASPLASVSDPIYPENLDRTSDQPADTEDETASAATPPPSSPTDPFEGFGSFAG